MVNRILRDPSAIGSNWHKTNVGKGKANLTVTGQELELEGLSINSLFIVRYSYLNTISINDFYVTFECGCIGTVYFLFHLDGAANYSVATNNNNNSNDLTYFALSISTSSKCFNLDQM